MNPIESVSEWCEGRKTCTSGQRRLLPLPEGNVAHLIAAQAAEIETLRAEVDRLSEALRELEERKQRDDTALLRQALEALEGWIFVGMPKDVETYCRCMDSTLTAADKLRERLGWGPANVPPLPR